MFLLFELQRANKRKTNRRPSTTTNWPFVVRFDLTFDDLHAMPAVFPVRIKLLHIPRSITSISEDAVFTAPKR